MKRKVFIHTYSEPSTWLDGPADVDRITTTPDGAKLLFSAHLSVIVCSATRPHIPQLQSDQSLHRSWLSW
jgi:hypothetical protein